MGKETSELRTERIQVKFTLQEIQRVKAVAQANGLAVGTFCRRAVLRQCEENGRLFDLSSTEA